MFFIIFFITACNNSKITKKYNDISNLTKEKMINKDILIVEEGNDDKKTNDIDSEKLVDNKKDEKFLNEKEKELNEDNVIKHNDDDDFVDTENDDYPKHKGRIDCLEIDECISKSVPIQYEFKNIISDIFYLEVLSKSDKILGYYIDYSFKNYKYEDYPMCMNKLTSLNEKIKNLDFEFTCDDNGLFSIKEVQ